MKKIIPIFAIACTMMSCGNNAQNEAAQKTVDSLKTEMVKKQTIDSMNAVATQPVGVNNEQPARVSANASGTGHGGAHNAYTSNTINTTNNSTTTAVAPAAVQQKKRDGWSAKAKGAVIGAGAGAITGALVDKKKGQGAVIGGLLGAGAGLGAGAIIDKKEKDK